MAATTTTPTASATAAAAADDAAAAATRTWLITGASSGLGQALAIAALAAGHTVLGTTRNVSAAQHNCPAFEANGGRWLPLDPAHSDAEQQFAKVSREHDVDVLVNNAGYAFIGGVEDSSEQEMREQMEVNFYGPLRTVKACLPTMRARGRGNIVLISSGAGFIARPARASYSASKFAIEAVHESLAHELRSFAVHVLIVEPGSFRTPFVNRLVNPAAHEATGGVSSAYKGTAVDAMVSAGRNVTGIPDFIRGDPGKAATAILKAVDGGHAYLRFPLGQDCVAALESKIAELQHDLDATRAVAMATDVD